MARQDDSTKAFLELHSDEVEEIVNEPPAIILRIGMTIFMLFLAVLLFFTWWVSYPDIVSADFTLTAKDPPRLVVVRSDGKIVKLLVNDNDRVRAGDIIAYSESIAEHSQVLALERAIDGLIQQLNRGKWSSIETFPTSDYSRLGEIQIDFAAFEQELVRLRSYLEDGFYLRKKKLLMNDYTDLKDLYAVIDEQIQMQNEDIILGEKEYEVQKRLFQNRVISELDFRKETAKMLGRKAPLKALSASKISNHTALTSKERELLELDNQVFETKSLFLQKLQTLRSQIEQWRQKYVLFSPIAGKLSFSAPWQEQQYVTSGTNFLVVEPDSALYQGIVRISQTNVGKLSVGQDVLVKLQGYPYREFGMIQGNLSQISKAPGTDSTYWGYIGLPNQLTSQYQRKIPYRNGLTGTAEIITNKRRLIERIFVVLTFSRGGK